MSISYAERKLEGDWAVFAKIAGYFVYKVPLEDREDFFHYLLVEMDKVKSKYTISVKPLTEASLMMVASYRLKDYWRKRKYRLFGLYCSHCTIEQRKECQALKAPSECPKKKARILVSMEKIISNGDGDGHKPTELGDLIADDKAIDLDALLDAKSSLEKLPPKIVLIGKKLVKEDLLSENQRRYLLLFRNGEAKPRPGRELEIYHERRSQGLCVHCGKESGQFAYCPECKEKNRVLRKRYRKKQGQWLKTTRDYWRRQGRCPRCGRAPTPGYKTCPSCLIKQRKYLQRHRERVKHLQLKPVTLSLPSPIEQHQEAKELEAVLV